MEIDLRTIDLAPARTSTVLARFAELPSGRGFTFVSALNESEALARLQAEHPGEFEWYPIEEGPIHRVVVARRAANAPRRRQVLEFMEADHRRIHALLDALGQAVLAGSLDGVQQTVRELRTSLARHFRIEEERLLPVVAERFATPRGPAVVLREEHIRIAEMVDSLEAATIDGDSGEVGALAIALDDLLVHHAGIEERILYALTDLLLNDEERDALVRRCQLL